MSKTGTLNDFAEPAELSVQLNANELSTLSETELRGLCGALRQEADQRRRSLTTAVHELRTPMAITSGYIEVLLTEKVGALSERQRAILEDMRANQTRLQRFVDDFLTVSAIESDAVNLNREPADLNAALQEVCTLWSSRFREKSINLFFSACDELTPFPFDIFKIQHVLKNLLQNALTFTPAGGTVWVSVQKIAWERRLAQQPLDREERRKLDSKLPKAARVIVSDTGCGIEPEFHTEIFQEFRTLSRKGQQPRSAGLGLSIAKRLVNAHAGRIWVESKPGHGSKFCFVLPLREGDRR